MWQGSGSRPQEPSLSVTFKYHPRFRELVSRISSQQVKKYKENVVTKMLPFTFDVEDISVEMEENEDHIFDTYVLSLPRFSENALNYRGHDYKYLRKTLRLHASKWNNNVAIDIAIKYMPRYLLGRNLPAHKQQLFGLSSGLITFDEKDMYHDAQRLYSKVLEAKGYMTTVPQAYKFIWQNTDEFPDIDLPYGPSYMPRGIFQSFDEYVAFHAKL